MPKRIKDYATAAATIATDDYFAIDGVTNGTRKTLLTAVGDTGVLFAAGTAAAPKLGVGTAGNGFFAGYGNTVGIATNGLERWYVDSFGTLTSNVQSTPVIRMQPALTATACGIEWNDGGAVLASYLKYSVNGVELAINAGKAASSGTVVFYTNTVDAGRFTSARNFLVGVGSSETGLTGAGGGKFGGTTSAVSSVAGTVVIGNLTAATTVAIGGGIVRAGTSLISDGNAAITGALTTSGGRVKALAAKTATYTILVTDHIIVGNHATVAFTLTLPTLAAAGVGREFIIKNKNGAIVTVDANGSETIDGVLTRDLAFMESITIVSDGTQWLIL